MPLGRRARQVILSTTTRRFSLTHSLTRTVPKTKVGLEEAPKCKQRGALLQSPTSGVQWRSNVRDCAGVICLTNTACTVLARTGYRAGFGTPAAVLFRTRIRRQGWCGPTGCGAGVQCPTKQRFSRRFRIWTRPDFGETQGNQTEPFPIDLGYLLLNLL